MQRKSNYLANKISYKKYNFIRLIYTFIPYQEQKRLAVDLEEQLALPPDKRRSHVREDCKYKEMVMDFIATLNIPESFQVPKFTKCFCGDCCPTPHLEYRGQPLMMYAVPQHYVRCVAARGKLNCCFLLPQF